MSELFAPTLTDMILCIERELRLRRLVYPRRVADGRLTRAKADREIETMEAVLKILSNLTERQL